MAWQQGSISTTPGLTSERARLPPSAGELLLQEEVAKVPGSVLLGFGKRSQSVSIADTKGCLPWAQLIYSNQAICCIWGPPACPGTTGSAAR